MCFVCEVIAPRKTELIWHDPDSQVSDVIRGEEQIGFPALNVNIKSEGLDKMASSVEGFSAKLSDITDRTLPLFDSLTDLVGSGPGSQTLLSALKQNAHMICFNLFSISRANTIPEFIGGGVNLFSNLGFDRVLINKLTEWFSTKPVEEQSFENTQRLLLLALSTFSTLSPSNFLEKFNLANNMKEMEAMNKLFDIMANVMSELGIDVTAKARNLRKLRSTLIDVMTQLPDFEFDLIHNQTKFLNFSYYSRFTKMKATVDELRSDVSSHSYAELRNSSFNAELMEVFRRIKTMSDTIEAIRREAKSRPKPQAFLFVGDSQIGKTECVLEIIRRIRSNKRNSPLCQDMSNWTTWNHNATDAYHQGYIGQEIHVVDDLFQRSDNIDHADMINFVSSNPYLTRQADLSSKGRPYWARLLLGSVNILPASSKAIEKMEALKNRFTIIDCKCNGTPPRDAVVIDKNFPHLSFKMGGWDVHHLNQSQDTTLDEIVDIIMDDLENADSFYRSRDEDEDYEENFSDTVSGEEQIQKVAGEMVYSHLYSGFLKELQEHNRPLFIKLRCARVDLGGRSVRAVDYVHQLKIEYTYQLLSKLQEQGTLPEGDLLFGYNKKLYHWKNKDILDTQRYYIPRDDDVLNDDDIEFDIGFVNYCKDKFQKFYWTKWHGLAQMFSNYKAAGIFVSGFLGLPFLICSVLLAQFSGFLPQYGQSWRSKGKAQGLERDDFWFTALGFTFDIASLTLTTGILAYGLYRFLTILNSTKISSHCKSCLKWYKQSDYSSFLDTQCKLMCKETELYDCFANKAALRRECVACLENKCEGNCFHTMEINPEQLDSRYLQLITSMSDLFDEESSPEGKRLVAPKMRRLQRATLEELVDELLAEEEGSPEGKRMIAPKMRRLKANLEELKNRRKNTNFNKLKDLIRQNRSVEEVVEKKKIEDDYINIQGEVVEEKPEEEVIIGYSANSSSVGSNQKPPPRLVRARQEELKSEIIRGELQACLDEGVKNTMAVLCNRTVKVFRENSVRDLSGSLHGLAFGKYIITPQHIHVHGDKNWKYYAFIRESKHELKFVSENTKMDIALWQIPQTVSPFDLRVYKHLMTEDDMEKYLTKRSPGYQFIPGVAPYGLIERIMIDYKISTTHFRLNDGRHKELGKSLMIEATTTSSPLTSRGDCGGFIMVENPLVTTKLVGFHVVGAGRNAYSATLTRELLNDLLPKEDRMSLIKGVEQVNIDAFEDKEYKIVESSKGDLVDILDLVKYHDDNQIYMPEGDFEYLGDITYSKPQKVTCLKEHPFKPLFKCTVKPAALDYSQVDIEHIDLIPKNKKGIPDLMMMKAAKYGKYPPKLESRYSQIISNLKDTVVEHCVDVLGEEDVGPCSWEEAVGGDPLDTASHKLKGQTSAGIGWDRSPKGAPIKKSSYFTKTEPQRIDESTPQGKKLMDTLILTEQLMAQGYRTLSIDKNCLKDEPRPLDKAWKPRMFKARPLDKVILKRKYFLKHKVAWTKAGLRLNHAVGLNPMSASWASLYYHLTSCNDVGFDADFGGFDTNQLACFQELSNSIKVEVIKRIMAKQGKPLTKEQIKIMEGLLQESVDSISSIYSNVIMDRHGNSSGDPNTTEDNTEVNDLYHFFCFIVIMAENRFGKDWTFEQAQVFIDYQLYRKYVKAVFFGDDLVIVADPEIEFTFSRVQRIMTDVLEQDYTSASKEHDSAERPISELTFLKRKFLVLKPNFVAAPIDKGSIEQRFCYTMVEEHDIETHALLIKEGLLEACLHGPSYYRELAEKLKAGVSQLRWNEHPSMTGVFLGYSSMRDCYFQRYDSGSF